MNYALKILIEKVEEIREVQDLCIKNDNQKDFEAIQEEKIDPLISAINLINLAETIKN